MATTLVRMFPKSTLLIGKGDWEALTEPAKANPMANPATFAPWIKGGSKAVPVSGDKDVFDDGTVVMLNTPGHTPGHHSLLVKLKEKGYVLLSGDLAHFRENYDTNGIANGCNLSARGDGCQNAGRPSGKRRLWRS